MKYLLSMIVLFCWCLVASAQFCPCTGGGVCTCGPNCPCALVSHQDGQQLPQDQGAVYTGLYAKAIKEGKPLVVSVGVDALPDPEWLSCRFDKLPGAEGKCVVLARPLGDLLIWAQTLAPHNARCQECVRAALAKLAGLPTGATAVSNVVQSTAKVYQTAYSQCAGGNCGGQYYGGYTYAPAYSYTPTYTYGNSYGNCVSGNCGGGRIGGYAPTYGGMGYGSFGGGGGCAGGRCGR
jgi:hypothetical protein